jgi:hypothetical protein
MTPSQQRKKLNNALAKIKSKVLQDWIDEASDICPELEIALQGIYCGREGRIHEQLPSPYSSCYITMGWHTVANDPKVEFAYIS